MKLYAEITDEDLLFQLIHVLGATFYRPVGNGEYEVVYYTNERTVRYQGKIRPDNVKVLENQGWKVSKIEFDEFNGIIKIAQ